MWSIHDFLAYGLFAGCVSKGHVGCPSCGPTTEVHFSRKLKKMIFCGSWPYLLPINKFKLLSMVKQKIWWLLCD